ncbi:MAG: cytochrome C [Rhodocyclaceae bacterium]|nr:cytochrome C [Rhodocyclaceae bacterium]
MLLPLLLFLAIPAALALNIESAIMPGELIRGHEKAEADCANCHVRFDRAAQPRLCMACHKEVGQDVRLRQGYHGRLKDAECRTCHTDHKGRGAHIAVLDEKAFDHAGTDFQLQGKHRPAACRDCHRPGKKHRDAPSECEGCHRKDDVHKTALGNRCGTCHTARDWKETGFDHGKSRFPLRLAHAKVECADCHPDKRYAGAPKECNGCHREDDDHKGQFGNRCDKCHDEGQWKRFFFQHERDTRFALRDRHRPVKCTACHKGTLYRERIGSACVSCHRGDDVHKGELGQKCESCHNERNWKAGKFDHEAAFPLRGAHREARCDGCHRARNYADKPPTACFSCHEKDDRHRGQLGRQCKDCHTDRNWRVPEFDHERSQFPLRDRHVQVACAKCHSTPAFRDAARECTGCHRKDDVHKQGLGEQCGKCHDAADWKRGRFDHDRETVFVLAGAHRRIRCHACHDKPWTGRSIAAAECYGCHKRDDIHFGTYGTRCERCHAPDDWRHIIDPEYRSATRERKGGVK